MITKDKFLTEEDKQNFLLNVIKWAKAQVNFKDTEYYKKHFGKRSK